MNKPGNDSGHPFQNPASLDDISVPYAGRVFTEDEVVAAVSSTLDFWLTFGTRRSSPRERISVLLRYKKTLLVNSGSSANLIAFASLTSHLMDEDKRIRPGDEVITCAAGFPTTVAPIIQNGCIPVFSIMILPLVISNVTAWKKHIKRVRPRLSC